MISIFSKFKINGGSERRCAELANGIVKLGLPVRILCREDKFPPQLQKILDPKVELVLDCLKKPEYFYSSDQILTVNTDSREFTSTAYWKTFLDIEKLRGKTMVFLFNFIVSPARSLNDFEKIGANVGIITTNDRFFKELSSKDKHNNVKHLPRMVLESPIDPSKLIRAENPDSSTFKAGFLSKAYDDKWNDDIVTLITKLSELSSESRKFVFKLMGAKHSLRDVLSKMPNVGVYGENAFSVSDFLKDCNVFVFFPSYKRQEPWARVIGEAMMAGLPILALDNEGGTKSQVIDGNNGFLCKTLQDFVDKSVYLFANPELARKMGKNSYIYASEFTSENICKKLVKFMDKVGDK